MDIYLIRHTRLALEAGICYGRSEIELAPAFDDQVNLLRTRLPQDIDSTYSSPLKRCSQLAACFSDNAQLDQRLLEYDFGDWELTAWDDIDQPSLQAWMQDFVQVRPPGGETLNEMFERVSTFFDDLRGNDSDSALIVTHAGVMRCAWAYVLQIPLAQIFKVNVGYGTVLHIQLGDNPEHDAIFTD